MILNDNPKRLCVYFIYDKDGIIDDYIIYQIKDLKKNVSFLHCVINGNLTDEGKEKLEAVADEVFERENKGNDIGAYKAALEHMGWDMIGEYDEIVLMNNTCFGPVYPFEEVFNWAKEQDVELWGLTHGEKIDWLGTDNYLHFNKRKKHIQSYFLAFRKPLVGNRFLTNFFREIPDDASYIMSVCVFEYAFPGYFEQHGYKSAVYCDDRKNTNYPLLHRPVLLLKEYRMPLFKKRSFFHHYTDVMNNTGGEATYELINFIEEETDYDMSMVWKSVLRITSLSDLVRCAQLNRVLSSKAVIGGSLCAAKIGVVYHAFYEDLFDESIAYLRNFPKGTEYLISTGSEKNRNILQNKLKIKNIDATVTVVENRGRDASALLVGAIDFIKKFDLICFAHDKKAANIYPETVGHSWFNKLNQNMFATKEYVINVINTFVNEKNLGIAFPSPPNHQSYSYSIGNGWMGNFRNTQKLLSDFGIDVKINEHTLCVAPLGTCFWFRPGALKKLFAGYDGKGWEYEDFPTETDNCDRTILNSIEHSYAYFAQDAGYYPVYLYNSEFAAIELTNLEFFKSGSEEMREWTEKLALNSIGIATESKSAVEITEQQNQKINEQANLIEQLNREIGKQTNEIEHLNLKIEQLENETGQKNLEIDRQANEIGQKNLEIDRQANEIEQNNLKINELTNAVEQNALIIDRQANEIGLQQLKINEQTDAIEHQNFRLSEHFNIFEQYKTQIQKLTFELNENNERMNLMRQQIEHQNAEIDSLYHSKSWRITAQLRKVFSFIRSLLKGRPQA